jgi:hypothetical protein
MIHQFSNDIMTHDDGIPTPYDAMRSSPIRHRVIHEHQTGKAVWTFWWPSVPELRVLITLGSEALECFKDLDRGLARP